MNKPLFFSYEQKPQPADNFTVARFDLRINPAAGRPRAVLVLLNGYNSDAGERVHDPATNAYADRLGMAVLACTFMCVKDESKPREVWHYAAAASGSGAALERALASFAWQADNAELENLPLFILGHSAGGQFAYGFACYAPHRVAAFAALKGGIYPAKPQQETYRVPALFFAGELDTPERQAGILAVFEDGRRNRAPWCHTIEKGAGHDPDRCPELVFPFFEAVATLRLRGRDEPLAPVSVTESGILFARDEKSREEENAPDSTALNWLPEQGLIEIWRRLSTAHRK